MPFSLVSQKIFLIGSEFYRSLQHGSSPALSLPIILHLSSSSITDFPFSSASSTSFCFSLSLKSPWFSHPFLCSVFSLSYSPDCSSFQRVPETSTAVHLISETYDTAVLSRHHLNFSSKPSCSHQHINHNHLVLYSISRVKIFLTIMLNSLFILCFFSPLSVFKVSNLKKIIFIYYHCRG